MLPVRRLVTVWLLEVSSCYPTLHVQDWDYLGLDRPIEAPVHKAVTHTYGTGTVRRHLDAAAVVISQSKRRAPLSSLTHNLSVAYFEQPEQGTHRVWPVEQSSRIIRVASVILQSSFSVTTKANGVCSV